MLDTNTRYVDSHVPNFLNKILKIVSVTFLRMSFAISSFLIAIDNQRQEKTQRWREIKGKRNGKKEGEKK